MRVQTTADRSSRRPAVVVAGLVLLVAAVLAGCSDDASTLDRPATERSVGRAVAAEVAPPVAATTCAGPLTAGQGERFTCQVRLGAGAGTLEVRVRQVDDDATLEVTPTAAVRSDAELAEALRAQLRQQFDRSFQVDCGDAGPTVRPPDSVLACTARDRTSRRTVDVRIIDEDGTLSFTVRPPRD